MGKIRILSEDVANRIAAGEVIERPASVVKECVENSIDAGATEIVIKIVNGGRDLIQIVDNGHGMTEEDAFLAFERHATSKISSADDIIHISTMGFRGEALPSIASISQFHLITKTADSEVATEIHYSGGKLDTVQKTAAKTGTTITIKNIFYNVPARRKFLKSEQVEYKHILNYIHYQSVLFPHISFVLFNNHKEKLNYPATSSIENRMLDVFGTSFVKQKFSYFAKEATVIKIHGYLQDIEHLDQANVLEAHYIYVNNRFINDKSVYSAIKAAYEPFLKKYRFFDKGKLPNYILFIDINPEEIDVNVHPAKTEIRFRNNSAVFQFVKDAVYECLHERDTKRYEEAKQKITSLPLASPLTPTEQIITKNFFTIPDTKHDVARYTYTDNLFPDISPKQNKPMETPIFKQNDSSEQIPQKININDLEKNIVTPNQAINAAPFVPLNEGEDSSTIPSDTLTRGWDSVKNTTELNTKFNHDQYLVLKTLKEDFIQLWQLHNTYIFIQVDDGFVAIDQHAAHERILYEKMLRNIDEKKPNKQKLVFPLVIDLPNYLSENIKNLIEENEETFNSLGFTIKSFSGNSVVIDEIPSEIEYWDGGDIFVEILKQLEDELKETKDFRIASAASLACKASIKAGKKLTKKEMHELVTELFTCEFPFQCPHGRPLIIKVKLADIEKMFKRIV